MSRSGRATSQQDMWSTHGRFRCWTRSRLRSGRRTHDRRRNLGSLLAALSLLGAVVWFVEAVGLRVQHTSSLPRGLYRVERTGSPPTLHRGSIGLWCLPKPWAQWALVRGYVHAGVCASGVEPLAKIVLAGEGDTVDFDARGVTIGGRLLPRTAAPLHDATGRAIAPVAYGRYVIHRDEAWVWSPYSDRSFDSRYLGALPRSLLVSGVEPIWVWP
jgi:conjugative transfer signal peptidase TraF